MTGGDDLEERVILAGLLSDSQYVGVTDERIGGAIVFAVRAVSAPPGKAEWFRAAATALLEDFTTGRGLQSPRLG